jgi:hypothetical protein
MPTHWLVDEDTIDPDGVDRRKSERDKSRISVALN